MKMIVTTSLGMDQDLVQEAKSLALDLSIDYIARDKQSVRRLLADRDGVFVVYRDRLVLERKGQQALFFHPDTAILRLKADRDPLVELLGIGHKRIVDATLGMASDSIVMAAQGHDVVGIESSQYIHYLVSKGLQSYQTGQVMLDKALRSIQTIHQDNLSFLKSQKNNSFDIIYFDPMFSKQIEESRNLIGLNGLANPSRLTKELMREAQRVAAEKIIVKAHFKDSIFEDLGFVRHVRPNQKFHYGEMCLEDKK